MLGGDDKKQNLKTVHWHYNNQIHLTRTPELHTRGPRMKPLAVSAGTTYSVIRLGTQYLVLSTRAHLPHLPLQPASRMCPMSLFLVCTRGGAGGRGPAGPRLPRLSTTSPLAMSSTAIRGILSIEPAVIARKNGCHLNRARLSHHFLHRRHLRRHQPLPRHVWYGTGRREPREFSIPAALVL